MADAALPRKRFGRNRRKYQRSSPASPRGFGAGRGLSGDDGDFAASRRAPAELQRSPSLRGPRLRRGSNKNTSADLQIEAQKIALFRAMALKRRDSRVQGRVKRRWSAEDGDYQRHTRLNAECASLAAASWQRAMDYVLHASGGSERSATRILDAVPDAGAEEGSSAYIAARALEIASGAVDEKGAPQCPAAADNSPGPADGASTSSSGARAEIDTEEPEDGARCSGEPAAVHAGPEEGLRASALRVDDEALLPGTVIYRCLRNELAVLNERHSAISVGAGVVVDLCQPLPFPKMVEIVLRDNKSRAFVRARLLKDVFADAFGTSNDGVLWHALREDGDAPPTLKERMRRSACALLSLGPCWFNPVTSSCWHHTNVWLGLGWRPGRPQDVGVLTGEVGRLTSSITRTSRPLSTEETATSVVKIATALLNVVVSMRRGNGESEARSDQGTGAQGGDSTRAP